MVVLALLGLFVLILLLYGPKLADGFYQLFRQLPAAVERLRGTLGQYAWGPAVMDALSRAGRTLTSPQELGKIAGIFSTAFGAFGSMLIVVVLGLYFAVDPGKYINGTARLFSREHRDDVFEVFDRLGHALRWWLLGWLAAILDFVPNIGPLIAAIPAIMVGMSQGGSTVIFLIVLYLVVQGLEGYLIGPVYPAADGFDAAGFTADGAAGDGDRCGHSWSFARVAVDRGRDGAGSDAVYAQCTGRGCGTGLRPFRV